MVAVVPGHIHGSSHSIVPCSAECGEIYCSASCRDHHWHHHGHRLLCTGYISDEEAESHPLMAFKIHAISTNEIFLMVADVFAIIITRAELKRESDGSDLVEALRWASQPLESYVRNLWWEAAKAPPGKPTFGFKKNSQRFG